MAVNFEDDSTEHAIERVKPQKPVPKKQSGIAPSANTVTTNNLSNFVQQVDQEVQKTSGDLRSAIRGYAHHQADDLVDAIAEMPTMFIDRLGEGLEKLEVDKDSFRETRQRVAKIFAGYSGIA